MFVDSWMHKRVYRYFNPMELYIDDIISGNNRVKIFFIDGILICRPNVG
jgi:hypothetical protein